MKSRQIQWYTFIHLYIFTIEKSQNLLASRTGNPGQSHTQPEKAYCDVGFAAIVLLFDCVEGNAQGNYLTYSYVAVP